MLVLRGGQGGAPEELEPSAAKVAQKGFQARVSVVIPTYCRPNDLSDLLSSLLDQSVNPLEVIIVDDTPSQSIEHVCEDYKMRFNKAKVMVVYFKNVRERSTAIARNIGAKMARGDVLMFLDDDVVLYPNYIEKVLEAFEKCPEALVVAGWIVLPPIPMGPIHYFFDNALRRLFLLFHDSRNTCKYFEYPVILTKTTGVSWASGSNMAVKRSVFSQFQFDESLRDYAFMEDFLFSASIHKKYPNGLIMTPYARSTHKISQEGRLPISQLRSRTMQNRKYVLERLLGSRGLLVFGWQNLGLLIYRSIAKIRKWEVVAIS